MRINFALGISRITIKSPGIPRLYVFTTCIQNPFQLSYSNYCPRVPYGNPGQLGFDYTILSAIIWLYACSQMPKRGMIVQGYDMKFRQLCNLANSKNLLQPS